MSDPDVHDPTAIVDGKVVGQYLRHRVPVAGREVSLEAVVYSACGVFQLRCRSAEFVEAGERGVEVCLVEDFAAVDQVALDRQNVERPPLGVEALLRGPVRHLGDDRSEVAQPMHRLDVTAEVRRDFQRCTQKMPVMSPGIDVCDSSVVDVHPIWCRRG